MMKTGVGRVVGVCEWCGEYTGGLRLVKSIGEAVSVADEFGDSFYKNPFYSCQKCRERLGMIMGLVNVPEKESIEIKRSLFSLSGDKKELLRRFINIKKIFRGLVSDIYLISNNEIADDSDYKGKVNVVVAIRGLSLLSYVRWASRERKSILHLWNKKDTRSKFWTPRMARLVMALGKLNAKSEHLNIWIKSFSRIVSVDTLCGSPPEMVQIMPDFLYKLTE